MSTNPVYIQILLKKNCPYCKNVKDVIRKQLNKPPRVHNLPRIVITDSENENNPYRIQETVKDEPRTYPLMEIKATKDSAEAIKIVMDSKMIIQFLLSFDHQSMGEIHIPEHNN